MSRLKSWRWVTVNGKQFHLLDGRGRNRCTVWGVGAWYTWDEHGVGGENDIEQTIDRAKASATMAVIRQGWATLVGVGRRETRR